MASYFLCRGLRQRSSILLQSARDRKFSCNHIQKMEEPLHYILKTVWPFYGIVQKTHTQETDMNIKMLI